MTNSARAFAPLVVNYPLRGRMPTMVRPNGNTLQVLQSIPPANMPASLVVILHSVLEPKCNPASPPKPSCFATSLAASKQT
jgi:hypothetical protein